jgi:hydrogenase-1 operon protein HyaF
MATDARARLASIAVVSEGRAAPGVGADSGNVPLLMREIRHALESLLDSGATHVIDLRAIPLGPGEEERLLAALGVGELCATFDALGRSELQECSYAGVWRITHWNSADEVTGRFIEITFAPALLAADPEDVRAGLERLGLNGGE